MTWKSTSDPLPTHLVSKTDPHSHPRHHQSEKRGTSQNNIRKSLRPSTNISQDLTLAHPLLLLQILKKRHQIPLEHIERLLRHEREHRLRRILPFVQIPLLTREFDPRRDRDRTGRVVAVRDGPGVTEGREPDHDFVFVRGVGGGGRGGEDVVADIRDELDGVGTRKGVVPGGGDGGDGGEGSRGEGDDGVGVGFH